MALPHADAGEAVDVSPYEARLDSQRTVALFKSVDLEVMRLVLRAGQTLPPHKVSGEVTIQCIEGRLDVELEGVMRPLQAGQLLFLRGGALHAVKAVSNASALVTIALKT